MTGLLNVAKYVWGCVIHRLTWLIIAVVSYLPLHLSDLMLNLLGLTKHTAYIRVDGEREDIELSFRLHDPTFHMICFEQGRVTTFAFEKYHVTKDAHVLRDGEDYLIKNYERGASYLCII
jgi:hypothetical protein